MKINAVVYLLIPLVLCGCASQPKIIGFVNENLDFSQYSTYRLINYKVDDNDFSVEGKAAFNKIEMAIEAQMTTRNYQYAKEPDLVVRYEVVSSLESETQQQYYDGRYSPYYGGNNYSYYPRYRNVTTTMQEGILLIEFRDRQRQKLVWQASLDLNFTKKNNAIDVINEAVSLLFDDYPYVAGSNDKVIREDKKKKK